MRRLFLAVLIVLALAEGYAAVQWTRYALLFTSARRLDDAGNHADALGRMERAVLVRPCSATARAYVGDMAQQFLDDPRRTLSADDERSILDRAWAGYAGAVASTPLDAWSWSGLAEVAIREAQLKDRLAGVSLNVMEARSSGVLDPWRALALGAAQLAVAISPSGYQELDVLGAVYESAGDVARAADTYVRSARMMSAPSFHVWGLGRSFAGPIYDRLLAGLIAGIAEAPVYDRSLLHLEVARFAREQGDLSTAIAQARLSEQAARNRYERHQAAMALGAALDRDDPEGALQAWRRAELTGYDSGPVAANLAALELRLGDMREACAHYRAAVREASQDVPLRLRAAAACEQAGEIDTADQLLSEGFVDPTDAMPVADALLQFLERNNRQLTAQTLASQWQRDHPDRAEFRTWLARVTIAAPTEAPTAAPTAAPLTAVPRP
jgi:tetratricopeptide (TPR) repeat protein